MAAAARRQVSVEYDTPEPLNRRLNPNYSDHRSTDTPLSNQSRRLNARGRVYRGGSQSNKRRRLDSTASSANDVAQLTTDAISDDGNSSNGQGPRRSLTRALMETADSLKEAAKMATEACALAMRRINEL